MESSPGSSSLSLKDPNSAVTETVDGDIGVPKDWKFWCIIFSLALSVLLTAVEFVGLLLKGRMHLTQNIS